MFTRAPQTWRLHKKGPRVETRSPLPTTHLAAYFLTLAGAEGFLVAFLLSACFFTLAEFLGLLSPMTLLLSTRAAVKRYTALRALCARGGSAPGGVCSAVCANVSGSALARMRLRELALTNCIM